MPQATILADTIFPPVHSLLRLDFNSEHSLPEVPYLYNERLSCLTRTWSAVLIVDIASLALQHGYGGWYDPRLWHLARMRASRNAVTLMAERYTTAIGSRLGQIRKCPVLDLEYTLWGGIVGEDGPGGIQLGDDGIGVAFAEFQEKPHNLRRKGILRAIYSKYNPADALEVIRSHPAMRLREQHFAAMRINWQDKVGNLRLITAELNIGIGRLAFLDNNPVGRPWGRQALPQVHVSDWPTDPAEYKTALLELAIGNFFRLALAEEETTVWEH
jgi:predicted enzyme involved in methoxymalonyl-ACP biosynthesis